MTKFSKSIKFKLWFIFVCFTVVILMFLYICQVIFLPDMYAYMKTRETVNTANVIKQNWHNDNLKTVVDDLAVKQQMRIAISIESENGTSFTYEVNRFYGINSPNFFITDTLKDVVLNSKDGMLLNPSYDGMQAMSLLTFVGEKTAPEGFICIYNYIEPIGTTLTIIQYIFSISSILILVLAFCISIVLASRISNPIIRISKSASKLITGEFNLTAGQHDFSEITALIENLNNASAAIVKTEKLRKDIMANISHDLRTPLTMIKAYAEMIRDLSGNNPQKREKHITVIIDEADRLTALVTDILDLSKLQSGVAEINLQTFDFSAHLKGVISRFGYLHDAEESCDVELCAEPGILILADVTKIEQAVYNLVNNAVNYAGDDRKVLVSLSSKDDKTARFQVTDHGVGIPPEKLENIWERYYKITGSENHKRKAKGTGLGLSIVKGVLDSHNFTFGVDSTTDVGSTFWFEFPKQRPETKPKAIETKAKPTN